MSGQRLYLVEAGLGKIDVGIAKVQIKASSPLLAGLAVGDVPQALRVADQDQLSGPRPTRPAGGTTRA